jgi:hypothetical protein
MPKVEYMPPLPDKAGNQINDINLKILTAAALIAGPAPQGASVRSADYLKRMDDALLLVQEFLRDRLSSMTAGKLVIDPKD